MANRDEIASAVRPRIGCVQGHCDGFQHAIEVTQDVVIPKPQDAIVVIGKPLVAYGISLIGCVVAAVDLDDKPSLATTKSTM